EEKDAKSVRDGLATLLPELRKKLAAGCSIEVVADRFGTDRKLIPSGQLRLFFPPNATQDEAAKVLSGVVAKLPGGRILSFARITGRGPEGTVLLVGTEPPADRGTLAPAGIAVRWVPADRLDTREQAPFVLELPVADCEAALKLLGDLLPALRKHGE